MTPTTRVRSEALDPPAPRRAARAAAVRDAAHAVAGRGARAGPPPVRGPGDLSVMVQWVRLEGEATGVVGPGGAWGEGLALEVLALHLRAAARVYAQVEASVAAVMWGVGAGADLAGRGGRLTEGSAAPRVTTV